MNGLPYYKRYPRDFIEGTIGLPFEVKVTYAFLLDLIYMQGGNLPDDARYIAGLLGVSTRKWTSLRTALIDAGKVRVEGKFLTNSRAASEIEDLAKFSRKQAENATGSRKNNDLEKPALSQGQNGQNSPSGAPNMAPESVRQNYLGVSTPESCVKHSGNIGENATTSSKNNDLQKPALSHTEPDTDTDKEGGGGSAHARDPDFRSRILKALGVDPDTGMAPGNTVILGKHSDMLMVERWQADLALSHADILAVIGDVMRSKRDGPPSSFRYFETQMRHASGRKQAAPLTPIAPTQGDPDGKHPSRPNGGAAGPHSGAGRLEGSRSLTSGFSRAVSRERGASPGD